MEKMDVEGLFAGLERLNREKEMLDFRVHAGAVDCVCALLEEAIGQGVFDRVQIDRISLAWEKEPGDWPAMWADFFAKGELVELESEQAWNLQEGLRKAAKYFDPRKVSGELEPDRSGEFTEYKQIRFDPSLEGVQRLRVLLLDEERLAAWERAQMELASRPGVEARKTKL